MSQGDLYIEDFTEDAYSEILRLARAYWRFIDFASHADAGPVCLWRHDIDMSVQRALRLARIEAEEGVRATYFVYLHSEFYNAMEDANVRPLKQIAEMGHHIGLHFDAGFYGLRIDGDDALSRFMALERAVVQELIECPVDAFSLHNFTACLANTSATSMGGMINATSREIADRYSYCSDSNGYWRHRRLRDVLTERSDKRLHVLTHPEWWTPTPMTPRQRAMRCIEGRATVLSELYVEMLGKFGRELRG